METSRSEAHGSLERIRIREDFQRFLIDGRSCGPGSLLLHLIPGASNMGDHHHHHCQAWGGKGVSPSTVPYTQPKCLGSCTIKKLCLTSTQFSSAAHKRRCCIIKSSSNCISRVSPHHTFTLPTRYSNSSSELRNQFLPFFLLSNPYHLIAHRKANAKGLSLLAAPL